jgi:hypothetical protein
MAGPTGSLEFASALAAVVVEMLVLAVKNLHSSSRLAICAN